MLIVIFFLSFSELFVCYQFVTNIDIRVYTITH